MYGPQCRCPPPPPPQHRPARLLKGGVAGAGMDTEASRGVSLLACLNFTSKMPWRKFGTPVQPRCVTKEAAARHRRSLTVRTAARILVGCAQDTLGATASTGPG